MPASRILITPEFRLSYPNLVTPRAYQDKGDKKYSLEMLFDPESMGKFKAPDEASGTFVDVNLAQIAAEVAKEEWNGINVKEAVGSGALGWPINSGDAKADKREMKKKSGDHYRGLKVISAKASLEYPPTLYVKKTDGGWGRMMRGMDSEESQANNLYAGGNYCFAEINVKAVETPQGNFVTVYVNSVKFLREGERLGGQSLMERFDGIGGGQSDHDPTAGMGSDDIPA